MNCRCLNLSIVKQKKKYDFYTSIFYPNIFTHYTHLNDDGDRIFEVFALFLDKHLLLKSTANLSISSVPTSQM